MSSKDTININYSSAVRQAKKLDEIADEIETAVRSFGGSMDSLAVSWKGSSSDQYRKRGGDVQKEMETSMKNIRAIAEAIRKTAVVYRNMENQKLENEKE